MISVHANGAQLPPKPDRAITLHTGTVCQRRTREARGQRGPADRLDPLASPAGRPGCRRGPERPASPGACTRPACAPRPARSQRGLSSRRPSPAALIGRADRTPLAVAQVPRPVAATATCSGRAWDDPVGTERFLRAGALVSSPGEACFSRDIPGNRPILNYMAKSP